jgi:hypothetical protein
MPLGQSFAPLPEQAPNGQNGRSGPISPVQEAIQTLNLRMPRVLGAGAPAPAPLLNSMGSAGLPMAEGMQDNPLLAAFLRMISGGFGSATGMMPGHTAATAAPSGGGTGYTSPANGYTSPATTTTSASIPKPRVVYQDNPDPTIGTPDAGSDPYYAPDTQRTDRQVYRETNYYPEIQSYF